MADSKTKHVLAEKAAEEQGGWLSKFLIAVLAITSLDEVFAVFRESTAGLKKLFSSTEAIAGEEGFGWIGFILKVLLIGLLIAFVGLVVFIATSWWSLLLLTLWVIYFIWRAQDGVSGKEATFFTGTGLLVIPSAGFYIWWAELITLSRVVWMVDVVLGIILVFSVIYAFIFCRERSK